MYDTQILSRLPTVPIRLYTSFQSLLGLGIFKIGNGARAPSDYFHTKKKFTESKKRSLKKKFSTFFCVYSSHTQPRLQPENVFSIDFNVNIRIRTH